MKNIEIINNICYVSNMRAHQLVTQHVQEHIDICK